MGCCPMWMPSVRYMEASRKASFELWSKPAKRWDLLFLASNRVKPSLLRGIEPVNGIEHACFDQFVGVYICRWRRRSTAWIGRACGFRSGLGRPYRETQNRVAKRLLMHPKERSPMCGELQGSPANSC